MKKLLIALILVIASFQLIAQTEGCVRSTEGTEFWFGFMEGRWDNPYGHELKVTITSAFDATFELFLEGGKTSFSTQTVSANSFIEVSIPTIQAEPIGSEMIRDLGIYIQADYPVNVYAMNQDFRSADAAVIYPVESLGKEYYAMCYEPHYDSYGSGLNGKNSEFVIVATEDNTEVSITPSKVTTAGQPAGVSFLVTLNAGQVYQVQSANTPGLEGQGDLTGSHIQSNKNIAVYSGNFATTVPRLGLGGELDPEDIEGYDHLYEQMPPLYSWGKEYYAVPLAGRIQDFYRIIAAEDGTTVDAGEFWEPFTLNKGEFKEIYLQGEQASRILSDKPILVVQYSASQEYYPGNNERGDPSMIVLSSTAQSKNNVTFMAYDSESIINYHINIVSLTDQVANLRLDGATITASPFVGTAYSYAQVELSSGSHTLQNTDPNEGFLAYVYGQGNMESYGYPVGFNLNVVLDLGQSSKFDGDTLLLCAGDTLILDAGPNFETYLWETGETSQQIKVTEEGLYKVEATIGACPPLLDSVYVFYSKPSVTIDYNNLVECAPATITLTANSDDAISYLWQSMDEDSLATTAVFDVDSTARYQLLVENEYGCPARDTVDVIVFGNPPITLSADALQCGDLETTVTVDFSTYPDSLWLTPPGHFHWSVSDPSLQLTNTTDRKTTVTASDYGTFELYYELETMNGCQSFDTLQIGFIPEAEADFTFNFQPSCVEYIDTLRFTGVVSDVDSLNWSFQSAQIVETLERGVYLLQVYPGQDEIPAIELQIEDGTCTASSYQEEPAEFAALRVLSFDFLADPTIACDSLVTTLYVTTDAGDLDFSWNTDGRSFSGAEAQVVYREAGLYDVQLVATDRNTGCTDSLTKVDLLEVLPAVIASFTVDKNPVSLENGLVSFNNTSENADSFEWNFGDGVTDQSYSPSHRYTELGDYIAQLTASSLYGCSDSASTTIAVVFGEIYAPNAFRPDSDIPENRVFMPTGLGLNNTSFTLQIFNRWGQVIFESESVDNPWEGFDQNGKEAPMGNYIWLATYTDTLGEKHQAKGQILLIR